MKPLRKSISKKRWNWWGLLPRHLLPSGLTRSQKSLKRGNPCGHGRCPCQYASSGSASTCRCRGGWRSRRGLARSDRGSEKRPNEADLYGGGFINPSDLPLPRRDLLNEKFYFPLKLLETTRGCPHHCDFCGVSKFFDFDTAIARSAKLSENSKPSSRGDRWWTLC